MGQARWPDSDRTYRKAKRLFHAATALIIGVPTIAAGAIFIAAAWLVGR